MADPNKAFDRPTDQVDPTGSGANNDEDELSEEELDGASGGLLRNVNLSPVFQPNPPPIKPVLSPQPPPIKSMPNPPPI